MSPPNNPLNSYPEISNTISSLFLSNHNSNSSKNPSIENKNQNQNEEIWKSNFSHFMKNSCHEMLDEIDFDLFDNCMMESLFNRFLTV